MIEPAKVCFITEKDIKYKSKLLENEPIFGSNEYHTEQELHSIVYFGSGGMKYVSLCFISPVCFERLVIPVKS